MPPSREKISRKTKVLRCIGMEGARRNVIPNMPRWRGKSSWFAGVADHGDEGLVGVFGVGEGVVEGDAEGGFAGFDLGGEVHAVGVDGFDGGGGGGGEVAVDFGVEEDGVGVVVVHVGADAIAYGGGDDVGHGFFWDLRLEDLVAIVPGCKSGRGGIL
jgi:hypothetical protein